MAHYAYKSCVYDRIPREYRDDYERRHEEETGEKFEGDAGHDGGYWHMTADYIDHLKAEVERLNVLLASPPVGEQQKAGE